MKKQDQKLLKSLVEGFLLEAEDLLASVEEAALALRSGDDTGETINELFRAFHTIKGSSGMCGLDEVAEFTHHLENLLVKTREGAIPVTAKLTDLVLKAKDHIKVLLGMEKGEASSAENLLREIEEYASSATDKNAGRQLEREREGEDGEERAERTWAIRFEPSRNMLACGTNPAALFDELRELGACEVVAHTENVPVLDEIVPERCYLWWTIRLTSRCEKNEIRNVFIFVEDDSKIEIEVEDDSKIEIEVEDDSKVQIERLEEVREPRRAEGEAQQENPGLERRTAAAMPKETAKESSVRVPSGRLDSLVNLVGELVINQSRLAQAASQNGSAELANPIQELERLLAELRDDVLGIRMLPIGTLFGRFRRLVHDLSNDLGKEVDLVTEGAETELDKSILDKLGEPLIHCLRNSLDHGIEPAEQRVAKGKPRRATVLLSAVHTGSDVVITIQDDGGGIDREAVRKKAIEKKLISADAALSDKDVLELILLPGFSTARQVTNVSGRGVGMDAVKRQIDELRGTLTLSSEAGQGTRVLITLPLTVAIIDGLLVDVGGELFIVPMAAVMENVELFSSQRAENNGRNVIAVRGELVPYIDLATAFALDNRPPAVAKVVIVQQDGQRVGLVVNSVLRTHQTVIQSLGKVFRNVNVVSGATIMGDGRVALILDIAAIIRHAERLCACERGEAGSGRAQPAAKEMEMELVSAN